jgi:hypothetical protein
MGLLALTNATSSVQSQPIQTTHPRDPAGPQTIQQNALRFNTDNSYFPQSETSVAVDPNNPSHIVGGFNDEKYFFCPVLPADCGSSFPPTVSGFTASADGGSSVAKSGDIPSPDGPAPNGFFLTSWGDPSVAASVDGNFFYASIGVNKYSSRFGNGIVIAKSNANLFNVSISCETPYSTPSINPCWSTITVFGNFNLPVFTFEDKDRIAVDRDPSSPYYGSVYIAWDHLLASFGRSAGFLARCDGNLVSCTMLWERSGAQEPLTGADPYVAWTTPVVDKQGNVHLAWCSFGTFTTLGPVSCRTRSSAPGGTHFGPPSNILSYMGNGTTLPNDTVVIGWATEQFRTAPGLFSITNDLSPKSNSLYFTVQVCTSGHYYQFSGFFGDDNPGNCAQSAVLLAQSTDSGASWSNPVTLSKPSVNDQPNVTVDPLTGTVYVVYYTAQNDPFSHRIDVVASISNNQGQTFHQARVTSVSDEPDSDPNMYDYLIGGGFGGSFTVPQYGDYFEAAAASGTLWVLFTGNYQVEQGTFQADPFLAELHQQ